MDEHNESLVTPEMLEAVEPRGDHTLGSVPLVKNTNRYLALPGSA